MAHIQDRWWTEVKGEDGKPSRQKTKVFGRGRRYKVRYIDPSGNERSKTFPDKKKKDAEDFLISVENAKREHKYIDPDAGNVGFTDYGREYLAHRGNDASSEETTDSRFRNHMIPFFGNRAIKLVKPETINKWNQWMTDQGYSETTKAVSFVTLKSIFAAAVENKRLTENPCSAKTVIVPKQRAKKVTPWPRKTVRAIREGLLPRYKTMVDLAAGCGHRQGEVFGIAEDDLDFDALEVHIKRQVKRVQSKLVFGLPKNDKERTVPLPASVARALKLHMETFPPVLITLPWEKPGAKEKVTARLIFTNALQDGIHRCTFSSKHWNRALRLAGIEVCRDNGMHALRHTYASVLIEAGVSIKEVSAHLGHHDPSFTWRTYVHLIPGNENRTRQALDKLAEEDETSDGLGAA
jgi:integrase